MVYQLLKIYHLEIYHPPCNNIFKLWKVLEMDSPLREELEIREQIIELQEGDKIIQILTQIIPEQGKEQ
jgi:hypothetical protein